MNAPIVILHGWGLSAKTFAPLAAELRRQHFQVFSPDLPGFGESVIPDRALNLEDYVTFLEMYFKKNHIEKPILIGHSFGGRVALKYQYQYPDSIHSLILTGTPGFTPIAKKKLAVFVAIAKIGKIFFNFPSVRNWYYYVVGAREYARAQGAMKETFKNVVSENLLDYMSSVRVPTLLVWGEQDIITPVWIAQKMKNVIHDAHVVIIPNADHGVAYKQPKEFFAAIYDFLLTLT